MSEVTRISDPYFVQTPNLSATNEVLGSTILTSRIIVLSPAGEASSQVGKAVVVADTGNLTVFGDIVRINGVISAPSRTIKIFCRRLEFFPGKGGSGISVNGKPGANKNKATSAADAGSDGRLNPTSIPATNGITGQDGGHGDPGNPGGEIQIYCGILVPFSDVVLSAEGGAGGNGADGQKGGPGGNGFSGYPTQMYDLGNGRVTYDYFGDRAFGGYGGCGGNGGNGGNGGAGGRITLHFMRLGNPEGSFQITANAAGGVGGNGAQPGEGGNGGNGGVPDRHRGPGIGAPAGGGGTCGLPGHRGYGGPMGRVNLGIPLPVIPECTTGGDDLGQPAAGIGIRGLSSVSWGANRLDVFVTGADNHVRTIDRKMTATRMRLGRWQYFYNVNTEDERAFRERLDKSLKFSIPEERTDGLPGQSFANPNQAAPAGTPGPGGAVPSPSLLRNKQNPDPGPPAANYNIADHQTVAYSDLAALADLDQLEMLFDYTRGRYLLTSLSTVSNDIIDAVTWLVLLGDSKDSRLLKSAAATLENLGKGRNIFSKNAQFAALGNLDNYEKELMAMLTLYAPVEATENLLRSAENSLTERKAYLENVCASQQSLVERLTKARTKKAAEAQAVLAEVQTLDNARLQLANSLASELQDLTIAISDTVKLTPADFVNLFSQLSFTNRDLMNPEGVSPSGVAATGAMLTSQAIDMATKAIENVPSDLGGSVNKKYVVRRMEYLQGTVKDLAGLKQSRDGLLKTNPSAEMRLLATRDQVESICSNFYESIPGAKAFSYLLDEYIEKVTARNEKVEEFNQLLSDVLYLDTEIGKTQAQRNQAAASLQTSASPGLPAMARYATALRRHAQERCVYQLYMASRVFTMQSLQSYDVFADVLGKLTSPSAPGEIDSAALNTGLIDLISKKLEDSESQRTSQSDFIPTGNRCSITLTPKTHSLLFNLLKSGESGSFTIPPATPNTTLDRNPFARMADVRLTHIRCLAHGMKTGNGSLLIELTHPGIETFVTEDGGSVRLNHRSTTVSRTYNTVTGLPVGNGALDENHCMIGPFCEWIVRIPRGGNTGLDFTALESLEIDFEGKSRAFPETAEPETAGGLG